MKIRARNFRRLVEANLEIDKLCLVAGQNDQAKTSFLQAIAAALAREPVGQFEIGKKDAALLVHDGADNAYIEISNDESSVALDWPACALKAVGTHPPQASPVALGMTSIATIPVKERAAALEPYMNAAPTRDDLAKAVSDGYEPETLDRLWNLIERDGWNAVHAAQIQQRQKTAGAWQQVTGETFGSVKAKSWQPKEWRRGLDETTDEELEQRCKTADQILEEAIAANAVDAAKVAEMQELVASLPDLQIKKDQAEIRYGNAVRARQKLPPASRETGLPCPHCGGLLVIHHDLAVTTLAKFDALPEGKLKEIRLAIAEANGTVEHDQALLTEARQALDKAQKAETILATAKQPATIPVETAKLHAQNARVELAMARQYTRATELAEQWEMLDEFIKILAPTGLRQTKLGTALDAFNKKLAALTDFADWCAVRIEEDLTISYDGRPFALLGASVQFRVITILKLAMAIEDKSALVLIDGADILDAGARDELFTLLENYGGPPVIVAMTLFAPTSAPDLAAAELGTTVWIKDGILGPLAKAA